MYFHVHSEDHRQPPDCVMNCQFLQAHPGNLAGQLGKNGFLVGGRAVRLGQVWAPQGIHEIGFGRHVAGAQSCWIHMQSRKEIQ